MTTPLDKLLDWYTTLAPDTVRRAGQHYAADAHFRDPFNDVRGIAAIEGIFHHMFENTDNPRFIIRERVMQGEQAFVTWLFEFGLRGQHYTVEGASHLRFTADGLVAAHRDYWDAAEELLQKLPIVGLPIRWLRRRLATPAARPAAY
ncbi:nuclear transport factor 2 family protein [Massilia sp. SR12]